MSPYRTFAQLLKYDPKWVDPRVIWKSMYPKEDGGLSDPEREDLIQIKSNGINIVSCRDIYYNIRTALRMGLEMASAGRKVVYLNSFARQKTLCDVAKEEYRKLPGASDLLNEEDSTKDPPRRATGLDLRFMDVRTGTWGRDAVKFHIENWKLSPQDDELADVLILNSFDFAPLTPRQKTQIARDLIAIQEKYQMTVVVFTQEIKSEMVPGMLCRGPMGILTTNAVTVSKVDWPKPREQKNSAESSKRAGNETVHEVPIDSYSRKPAGKNDDYGDYWGDPWKGVSVRSAAELAKFAKGPLLRQFMLDKSNDPDARYERGYQPTEWGLREKERMRIACGMAGYPKCAEGEEVVMGVLNGLREEEEVE